MAKSENVVKFRRGIHLNIGFVIFAIIIIYVMFNVFSYMTSENIAEYEVTQGTIATNNVYKGLVLRNETVYYAEHTGDINYYVRNGSRVSVTDVIYSIDTDGRIARQITAAEDVGEALGSDALTQIQAEISAYADSFDLNHFSTVYNFKNDLNSELTQNLSTAALSNLEKSVEKAVRANTFYPIRAKSPGIIFYSIDGMEAKDTDNFTEEDLNAANYIKNNLDAGNQINVADPVFKLIDSEKWSVVVSVDDEAAEKLKDRQNIQVRFCLDGYTTYASSTLIRRKGKYYLDLEFTNAMIRYATERYLDVELVLDVEQGLKIPNSAITTKEFFAIPKDFFSKGDNSNISGVLVNRVVDGKSKAVFETPTIYSQTEDAYFVDSEKLDEGDILIKSDSDETYPVGADTGTLQGVYNINKGYAVFKQIRILYQNNEYSIVEMKTDYGIALYDHIALDSSKISENDFVVN